MRNLFVFSLFLSLILIFAGPSFAQNKDEGLTKEMIQKMESRISKLSFQERRELNRVLTAKLQRLKQQIKFAKKAKLAELQLELLRIAKEIEILESVSLYAAESLTPTPEVAAIPKEELEFGPPPRATMIEPQAPRPITVVTPVPIRAIEEHPKSVSFGVAGGYLAGIPAALLELRIFEPMDLTATSLRIAAAYAEGEDGDKIMRKHTLLVLEGIYRLNPPQTKGIRSYIGFGLNYNIYTSEQKSGSFGEQAYYGIEGNFGPGQLFAEFGYGTIRTGFSPDYAGLGATLGYRF